MVGPPPDTWAVEPGRARAFPMAPGIWQLRLPLPWPTIQHVNAYVLESADGPVLVDCGSAGHPSHRDALAAGLEAAGFAVEEVAILVGTHTHSDHVGLAEWVIESSGCEFLMHPETAHFYDATLHPEAIDAKRRHRAWQEGVPESDLASYGDTSEEVDGVLSAVEPHRALRDGDRVGRWEVVETPGHCPTHVCLVDRERRAIILADLVAPVFAPWFDYGYSPDPVAEFLGSLDRVEALGPFDLALPGHGRAIEDLAGAIALHRDGVAQRVHDTLAAVRSGARGAFEVSQALFGGSPDAEVWRVTEAAAYLRHLRVTGAVTRREDAEGRFIYGLAG